MSRWISKDKWRCAFAKNSRLSLKRNRSAPKGVSVKFRLAVRTRQMDSFGSSERDSGAIQRRAISYAGEGDSGISGASSPLLASEATAVLIDGKESPFNRDKPKEKRYRVVSLGALLLAGVAVGFLFGSSFNSADSPLPLSSEQKSVNNSKRFNLDDIFAGRVPSTRRGSVPWIDWAKDGVTDGFYLVRNASSGDFYVGNAGIYGGRIWNGEDQDWSMDRDGPLELVLSASQVPKDVDGKPSWIDSIVPSRNVSGECAAFVLLETRRNKVWRHSHKSNYWICEMNSRRACLPLVSSSTTSNSSKQIDNYEMQIQHADFLPSGSIIFVRDNNLFTANPTNPSNSIQITHDGTAHRILNGIADWVYEEEILSQTSAIWIHPELDLVAFLRTDDSDVNQILIPIYDPNGDGATSLDEAYPKMKKLRYPKAGTTNPSVSLWVWDGTRGTELPGAPARVIGIEDVYVDQGVLKDFLIVDVAWIPGKHAKDAPRLLVRTTNRIQTEAIEFLASFDKAIGFWTAKRVRTHVEPDGAWIEAGPAVVLPFGGFLKVMNHPQDGRRHVALFKDAAAPDASWITWGSTWDVTEIVGVVNESLVIFEATLDPSTFESLESKPVSGIERYVWLVDLDTSTATGKRFPALRLLSRDTSPPPVWRRPWNSILQRLGRPLFGRVSHKIDRREEESISGPARFVAGRSSSGGGYLPLQYTGSGIPFSEVLRLSSSGPRILAERNDVLRNWTLEHELPTQRFFEVPLALEDGSEVPVNVLEIRPPAFDPTGKTEYRALFRVYGGPSSQVVSPSWSLGYHEALTSLEDDPFVIFQVDGRGTFGKGRNFTTAVHRRLGQLEPSDQHAVARHLASSLPYIDSGRMAIWGWSFGGCLTSRIVDTDTFEPRTFKAAIAVAPVTDWIFYDSVYAERYLDLPSRNEEGYRRAAVVGAGSGWQGGRTLIVHGTADDNVHFGNTAALTARLTGNLVPPEAWRIQVYTDSDHGVSSQDGKASQELYKLMARWLDTSLGSDCAVRTA